MQFCFGWLVGEIWWFDEMDSVDGSTPAVTGLGFCHQEYVEMVILGDLKEKASESRSVQCRLKLEYFLIHHLHGCEWSVKTTLESQGGAKRTFYPSLVSWQTTQCNGPTEGLQTQLKQQLKQHGNKSWQKVEHFCQTLADQSIETKKTRITARSHPRCTYFGFLFHFCWSLLPTLLQVSPCVSFCGFVGVWKILLGLRHCLNLFQTIQSWAIYITVLYTCT